MTPPPLKQTCVTINNQYVLDICPAHRFFWLALHFCAAQKKKSLTNFNLTLRLKNSRDTRCSKPWRTGQRHPSDACVNRPSIKKITQIECKNASYVLNYPCINRANFFKQTLNKLNDMGHSRNLATNNGCTSL